MIIIKVKGGLGNQLYQYALYRMLEEKKYESRLDITGYMNNKDKRAFELSNFKEIKYQVCTEQQRAQYVDDKGDIISKIRRKLFGDRSNIYYDKEVYTPEVLDFKEGYLDGYWANQSYFLPIISKLQQELEFPSVTERRNHEILDVICKTNSVSVHVRRGDYLLPKNEKLFGAICTDDYYKAAISYVRERYSDYNLFVFSDDSEYVKDKFHDENTTVIDWNKAEDSIYDMYLMSQCKVNICANSTFSMWAAILNKNKDKIMIRPKKHFHQEIIDEDALKKEWRGWVLIDEYGKIVQ